MYGARPTLADSVQTSDGSGNGAGRFGVGRNFTRFRRGFGTGGPGVPADPRSRTPHHPPVTGEAAAR
jgi:hypothetical protein